MPSLERVMPEGRPHVLFLHQKITSIGRSASNDLVLEDPSVTDFHAQVLFDGRDFQLIQVDANGVVTLNGKRKRRTKIVHHDRLGIGDVELVFSVFDEAIGAAKPEANSDVSAELSGMRRLADFNRRLLQLRAVPEQLEALVDEAIVVTGASKGFVVLLRDEHPQIAVGRGVAQTELPLSREQLSDSILAKVVETGQPLIVSDALNDTIFRSSASVMSLKLSSVMCVPLMARGQMIGLLYVGNDNVVSLFDRTSLDVLTVFAGQASFIVHNAILLDDLTTDRDRMASALDTQRYGDIVGACVGLREVFRKIDKVAPADVSVLITGETGTGKELIARELHRRSPRRNGPFIVVNCGAIPENLIESELFGHVRGAFTGAVSTRVGRFQAANGGTLFLDEIGELPIALQVKLLRALQERVVTKVGETKAEEVDIRVVSATHRDLESAIASGAFREDLYYRLNVINLHLPPLRERGEDVVLLAKFLLRKYADEIGSPVTGYAPKALDAMRAQRWPGNIRQLENCIKKAVVLADGALLTPHDLDVSEEGEPPILPLSQAREEFTRDYIVQVLERNGGNRAQTARDLGVDPRTIFRYLEREPRDPDGPGSGVPGFES